MQAAQLPGHCLQVCLHRVVGEVRAQVAGDVIGERPVLAAEQQRGPEAVAAVAVDGDDDVDVFEEAGLGRRVGGRDTM